MAERSTQLKIMGALLAGIGLFVTTTPSAPAPARCRRAPHAPRASPTRRRPRRRTARVSRARNARPDATAAGTDALDGGSTAGDRTSAAAPAPRPPPSRRPAEPAPVPSSAVRRATSTTTRPSVTTTPPTPSGPTVKHCSDFTWQQDAQAAYVANLADPWGLDGPPGPADDDGIACSLLPVDPARPPSTPAGARPPDPPKPEGLPTTPTIEELLAPTDNFFGVSTPQAPFDWKDFQIFAAAAQKLPSMVEFFQGWDREFPRDQVIETWRRGALPLLSWEPRPTVQPVGPDSDNTERARLHARVDHRRQPRRVHRPVRDRGARPRTARRDPLRPRDERQLVPVVGGAQRQQEG